MFYTPTKTHAGNPLPPGGLERRSAGQRWVCSSGEWTIIEKHFALGVVTETITMALDRDGEGRDSDTVLIDKATERIGPHPLGAGYGWADDVTVFAIANDGAAYFAIDHKGRLVATAARLTDVLAALPDF